MWRSIWLPAILVVIGCGGGPAPAPESSAGADPGAPSITHGPMLGRIGDDSVGVWARMSEPGSFRIFYGRTPDSMTQSIQVETAWDHDNANWGLLDNLESNTKYYYEVTAASAVQGTPELTGHFHTLPAQGDYFHPDHNPRGLPNIRFEFGCGNNQNLDAGSAFGPDLPTFQTMHDTLVRDDERNRIDFAIQNGDWLYEDDDARRYDPQSWMRQANCPRGRMPFVVQAMPSIVGVWENYKLYLSRGKPLANLHRYVPYFYTFDDHEIVNDVYGSGEVGRSDRRAVFRDIGLRAWYDYLGWANDMEDRSRDMLFGNATLTAGSDVLADPNARFDELGLPSDETLHVHWGTPDAGVMRGVDDTTGGDPNAGVYEVVERIDDDHLRIRPPARADSESAYSIGRRSYWRKRIANADFFFLDTRTYREMHDTSNRRGDISMLGETQREWLRMRMQTSEADFLFVVSSVNLTIPHVGGTGSAPGMPANKDDAWTAFLREREWLIKFWDDLDKPVMVLTGDLHNSFSIQVTDNVWEIASGPHNSVNHPASSEGDRPPNGRYDSFGRNVDIRWSTYLTDDTPNEHLSRPIYTLVSINNVFRNDRDSRPVWVAYPKPQVVFQFHDGVTGELLYAESVTAN